MKRASNRGRPVFPTTWRRDLFWSGMILLTFVTTGFGCGALDHMSGHATEETAEATQEPGEDPLEAEKIEAALLSQGYFNDAVPLSYNLQDELQTACERYGVEYSLALGLIEGESGFDPEAVGVDGHDFGLFQIRDSNFSWLSEETGEDPMTVTGNIRCGVWFMAYLHDRYGTWDEALTAYRWGHDNGDRNYANAVLARAEQWEGVVNG